MEKKKIKQTMQCLLSAEEKLALAQEMAQSTGKKSSLEAALKEISSQYKAQIVQQENLIQQASQRIRDGYEYREVDCEVEYNVPERGQKTIIRLDTGATSIEVMTMQEKADLFCNVESESDASGDGEDDSLSSGEGVE